MSILIDGGLEPYEELKPQRVENVGEAFMEWAENGWKIDKIITKGLTTEDGESCPYTFIRDVFIRKINELNELNKI